MSKAEVIFINPITENEVRVMDYGEDTNDLLSYEVSHAIGEVGGASVTLNNRNGTYTNSIVAGNQLIVKYDDARLFGGWVDKPNPSSAMSPGAYTRSFTFNGRDWTRRLLDRALEKNWDYQDVLLIAYDIVHNYCTPLDMDYPIGSSGVETSLSSVFDNSLEVFDYLMKRANYDYYTDQDEQEIVYFEEGTVDSEIELRLYKPDEEGYVHNANNILEHDWITGDAEDVWNYIIGLGKELEDGYTEFTAQFWDVPVNSTVTDETTEVMHGVGSLKWAKDGSPTDCYVELDIYNGGDGRFGYTEWDFTTFESEELSFGIKIKPSVTNLLDVGYIFIKLWDDTGKTVERRQIFAPGLKSVIVKSFCGFSCSVGKEVDIATNSVNAKNSWLGNADFSWKIRKIRIGIKEGLGDIEEFYLDGLKAPLQMRCIYQDATSQGTYLLKEYPLQLTDVESQIELEAKTLKFLNEHKDPVKALTVRAIGTEGIFYIGNQFIDAENKWLPGTTLTVDIPSEGIDEETYKILKVKHVYDALNPYNGHNYYVDLVLTKVSDGVSTDRLQALTEDVYLLTELRSQLAILQQEQQGNIARPPSLPRALSELYLLSPTQWQDFWQADQYPFTLSSGTSREADVDAVDGYVAKRESTDSSGDVVESTTLMMSDKAYGSYTFFVRMKIDEKPVLSTKICDIEIYDNTDSISYSVQIDTGDFSEDDEFNFFSVQGLINPTHDIRFNVKGFVTGVADLSVDWVGVTTFDVPFETVVVDTSRSQDVVLSNNDPHDKTDVNDHDNTLVNDHDQTGLTNNSPNHSGAANELIGNRSQQDQTDDNFALTTVDASWTEVVDLGEPTESCEEGWVFFQAYCASATPPQPYIRCKAGVDYYPDSDGIFMIAPFQYDHVFALFQIPKTLAGITVTVEMKMPSGSHQWLGYAYFWSVSKHTHTQTQPSGHGIDTDTEHALGEDKEHGLTAPESHGITQPTFTGSSDKHKHGLG